MIMALFIIGWLPSAVLVSSTDPSPLCHTIATFEQPIGHSMDSLVKRHVVSYCGQFLEPQIHIRESIVNPRTNQTLGAPRGDYYDLPQKEKKEEPAKAPSIQPSPLP